MITTRVCLSHFESMLLTEELVEIQNGQILGNFFWGGKFIRESFESKFQLCFIDLSNVNPLNAIVALKGTLMD